MPPRGGDPASPTRVNPAPRPRPPAAPAMPLQSSSSPVMSTTPPRAADAVPAAAAGAAGAVPADRAEWSWESGGRPLPLCSDSSEASPMRRPIGLLALLRRFDGLNELMLAPLESGGGPPPHGPSISRCRAGAITSGRLRCVARRFDAADDVADVGVPTRDVPADGTAVPGRRRSIPMTVVL